MPEQSAPAARAPFAVPVKACADRGWLVRLLGQYHFERAIFGSGTSNLGKRGPDRTRPVRKPRQERFLVKWPTTRTFHRFPPI